MAEKQLAWAGYSYKDLTDDDTFPMEARKVAGQQLRKVQRGDEPDDWKPFEEIAREQRKSASSFQTALLG